MLYSYNHHTTQGQHSMSATVSVTPTAKGHRVWLQALVSKGFTLPRYTVEYHGEHILITFSADGKRKVTQSKGGIIDLVGKKVTLWADGATSATVAYNVERNQILILRED